jgi:SAM-dependent methyltransferase
MTKDVRLVAEDGRRGQLSDTAAQVYEDFFVPALFGQFGPVLVEAAGIGPGDRVLDVATGTGIVARFALESAAPGGPVTGLDCNPGMLKVARAHGPGIAWRQGVAEALPFADASFDAVTSQFGIMFFDDRVAALREMWRVLAPGGRIAVAVWDAIGTSPGYAAMVGLLARLFGEATASALRAPFVLGDAGVFGALFAEAGIPGVTVERRDGTARFASVEDWVRTDVKGWTLADRIDAADYARLLAAARAELSGFAGPDGGIAFAAPALVATARKPG